MSNLKQKVNSSNDHEEGALITRTNRKDVRGVVETTTIKVMMVVKGLTGLDVKELGSGKDDKVLKVVMEIEIGIMIQPVEKEGGSEEKRERKRGKRREKKKETKSLNKIHLGFNN